jgi:hypothetical protein
MMVDLIDEIPTVLELIDRTWPRRSGLIRDRLGGPIGQNHPPAMKVA